MRVDMISLLPKRARVRTILWLVFSIVLLLDMAGVPFTRSIACMNEWCSDVNSDGVVNIFDVRTVAVALGSYPGHPKWNPRADVNDDDVVDIFDLVRVVRDFHTPACTTLGTLWSADSYWHMKIPVDAPLHPNSAEMVNWLINKDGHRDGHPYINYDYFTYPIYDVYESRPEVTVYDEAGTHGHWWYNVPIPTGAKASEDTDYCLTIIDWHKRETWDFWNMRHEPGYTDGQYYEWICGAGYCWDLDSTGVAPKDTVTTGGSMPRIAAAVTNEEIEAGVINHPLFCSLHTPKDNYRVYPPAPISGGKCSDTYAIPMGARIQLDPTLDLDAYGLSPTAKIIAKCLQDYGMIPKENAGSFCIYAEDISTANWSEDLGMILDSLPAQWRIIDYSVFGATEEYSPWP